MQTEKLYFEDFTLERQFSLGPQPILRDDVLDFAREFDPQPMHLDEEAGKNSLLGGLAASGWHTASLLMKMMCESYILRSTCQGAPGIEFMDWKKPVLVGDVLHGHSRVEERRALKSRPGIGLVTFRHELYNQNNELVLATRNGVMMAMRAEI